MLEELKERVFRCNFALAENGLVALTWGNVSAIDRERGLVVIKPSGVNYKDMQPRDMVVIDLSGNVAEGDLRPSSDAPTHLCLYRAFKDIGGVVHTHSVYATAWAQSGRDIPAYGTTHADAFFGDVPCTRALLREETEREYELNTGKVIAESFKDADYLSVPAALVRNHGPFAWGPTPEEAVENAVTLERAAQMAYITESLNKDAGRVPQYLLEKHYLRKHGKNAYYGQKSPKR